jgi:hypothetical protein
MKINFGKIDLKFENIYHNDDERLRRLSHLVFSLLDEKLSTFSSDSMIKSANKISLDQIVIPDVSVRAEMSDYEIASRCASAICQAIVDKVQ